MLLYGSLTPATAPLTVWYPAELLRENKRMLDKAIRELDRERMGLQNQEKKIVAEIKKMAKQGQMVRDSGLFRQSHFRTKQITRALTVVLPGRTLLKLWQSRWCAIGTPSQRCMA